MVDLLAFSSSVRKGDTLNYRELSLIFVFNSGIALSLSC
jgi:hypothetical protein